MDSNEVLVASTRPELGHLLLAKLGGRAAAEAAGVEGGCRYRLGLRTRYYAAAVRLLLVDAARAAQALALVPRSPQLSCLFLCSDIAEWRDHSEGLAEVFAAVTDGVRMVVLTTAAEGEEQEEELAQWCLTHQAEAVHFRFTDELPEGPSASLLATPSGLEAVMSALQCVRWAVEEEREENGARALRQECNSRHVGSSGEPSPRGASEALGEKENSEDEREEEDTQLDVKDEESNMAATPEEHRSEAEESPGVESPIADGEGTEDTVEELLARLPQQMDDDGLEAAFSSLHAITAEVRGLPDDQRTNAAAAVALRLAMLLGDDGEDF